MSKLSESLSKKIEKEVPVIVSSKTVCPVSESTTCIFLFSKEELKFKIVGSLQYNHKQQVEYFSADLPPYE